jgi:hypothetical protein
MKVNFLRLPGSGERQLDFPGHTTVSLQQVLDAARAQLSQDVTNGNEIAVDGVSVPKNAWGSTIVYAGSMVSATGVVKGALWASLLK